MKKLIICLTFTCCLISILFIPDKGIAQKKVKLDKNTFGEIEARHIGPATMSGRITSIDAVENDPRIVYVGTAGGGVWKSENAGIQFEAIFDKHNQSIGTITIDQKRPDTIWIGTGEVWVRNSVSVGDGIYKTTNGGKKWKHLGLDNSERISRILINPDNPDIVYAAVLGHLWNSNEDRGVYKTIDGGRTWEKILYVDENTGCSDMTMDPENPDLLYAAMWDFRRTPYNFRSGGPGSGLYKSIDGGATWNKISEDFPEGTTGRISVAFSKADPNIVFALIEAEESGLYKSMDKGETWKLTNDEPVIGHRPFYFSYIVPDPVEADRIYKPGFSLVVSDDGGEHFNSPFIDGGRVHSDLHAMWIDPSDNNFIYLGTDGGVYVSNDKANTWRYVRDLPVSTFYHVFADDKKPYNVYGGLQDNGSWMAPSKSPGGIGNRDWSYVGYGDGFNVFPDNQDPNIIYFQSQGGNINRKYISTGESKSIKPFEQEDIDELRFNWDTPILQNPLSNTLYVGAQYLFKSYDNGDTWIRISPDLTTNDQEKFNQDETGGLTLDNSSAENHCTIYTIAISEFDTNFIWVGTDDGNIQVTKNGEKKWKNVTGIIPGLPSTTWCSSIEPGKYDMNIAYATFDGHKQGDKTPYVYKTTDMGKNWFSLVDDNIKGYCHKILEDPVNPDLLYLGTEFGLYLSIDGGTTWTRFTGEIPEVSIRDMVIQERKNDLVLATHGRGILIIDDLTPIRQLTPELIEEDVAILETRPFELSYLGYAIDHTGDDEFTGYNPIGAVQIMYYLKKRHVFGEMILEIFDEDGNLLQTLPAGKRKGINRVVWQMYRKPPKVPSSVQLLGQAFVGPPYPPGDYTVKIHKDDNTYEGKIKVVYDPDSPHSEEARDLRLTIMVQAYDLLENLAFVDAQVVELRDKTEEKAEAVSDEKLKEQLLDLTGQMTTLRQDILATKQGRVTGERKLREKIASIYGGVMGYQGKPSNSQIERLNNLENEVNELGNKVSGIINKDLSEINEILKEQGISEIKIITLEEFIKEKK